MLVTTGVTRRALPIPIALLSGGHLRRSPKESDLLPSLSATSDSYFPLLEIAGLILVLLLVVIRFGIMYLTQGGAPTYFPTMGRTISEFFKAVGKWWYILGPTQAGGIVGLYVDVTAGTALPIGIWVALALGSFGAAVLVAFHSLRKERDQLRGTRAKLEPGYYRHPTVETTPPYVVIIEAITHYRIVIHNRGPAPARNVEIYIESIRNCRTGRYIDSEFPRKIERVGNVYDPSTINVDDRGVYELLRKHYMNTDMLLIVENIYQHMRLLPNENNDKWDIDIRVTADNAPALTFCMTAECGGRGCDVDLRIGPVRQFLKP